MPRRGKRQSPNALFFLMGGFIGVLISLFISLPIIYSQPTAYLSRADSPKCQDRIVAAGDGWYWKADCSHICTDPERHTDCPQNPADPDPKTSNWCYLFEEGLRCMQRVKEDAPVSSSSESQSSLPAPDNKDSGGACFSLGTHVYPEKDGDAWKFNTHVRVTSPQGGKDGHIQLFVNGNSKGWNQPWNKNVNNPFDIEPQYTDTPRISGGTVSMNYRVKVDECADLGNTHDITCTYGVANGQPTVAGDGCECRGCSETTTKPDTATSSQTTAAPGNPDLGGACFSLGTHVYADRDGTGWKFNTHLRVASPEGGGDGHIQLFVNGNSKGWNQPWNKNVNNPFDIEPQYTDSPRLTAGQVTMNYRVKIDECNKRGNTHDISCTYGVTNGSPYITGTGCECTSGNCVSAPAQPDTAKPSSSSKQSSSSSQPKQGASAPVPGSSSSSSSSTYNVFLPIVQNQAQQSQGSASSPSSNAPSAFCEGVPCQSPNELVTLWKKGDWYYPDPWSCYTEINKVAPYGVPSFCAGQPRTIGVSIYLWMNGTVHVNPAGNAFVEFGWDNNGWTQAKKWDVPASAFDKPMYTVADNAAVTLPVYCPSCSYKARLCYPERDSNTITCISSGSLPYGPYMLLGLDVKQ